MSVEKKRKIAKIALGAGLLVAVVFGLLYYFMIQLDTKNKENVPGYVIEVTDKGESNYEYKSKHIVDGEIVNLTGTSKTKVSMGNTIDAYRKSKGSKELTLEKPNPYLTMCPFAVVAGIGALAFVVGAVMLVVNKPRRNAKIAKKIKVNESSKI